MTKSILAAIFVIVLVSGELATAGQRGELYCTSCGYRATLTIGGARNSPRITIYCPQCRSFSQKSYATWREANQARDFVCPKCSGSNAIAYNGQSGFPCPRCNRKTTKFKTLMLFD